MLVDIRQKELDRAEEVFLTNIFGSTVPSGEVQWLLKFMDIDINDIIQNFESMVKPFMTHTGLVDAKLLKSAVARKYPILAAMIPEKDFRLVNLAESSSRMIAKLLKGGTKWSA